MSVLGGLGSFFAGNPQLAPMGGTEKVEDEKADPGWGVTPVQVLDKLE